MAGKLLKVEEVATLLRIGRTRVYELIRAGALESLRIGRLRRVEESALNVFIQQATD